MSDRLSAHLARVQSFITDRLLPFEAAHGVGFETDLPRALTREVWAMSAEAGVLQTMVPARLGGAGLSTTELCTLKEEIAASDAKLFLHVLGEFSGPPRIGFLYDHANDVQITRFLDPVARGEQAICFALTELEAGSDAAALSARAEKVPGGYRLTGVKRFSTGANMADCALVFAKTDPEAGKRGVSAFFVDLAAPGVTVTSDYVPTNGQRSHGDIHLDGYVAADAHRLGAEGAGLGIAMARITYNRILHCGTLIGLARRALRTGVARATERRQFGQAIADFQAIQHIIADAETGLFAARSMTHAAAARYDAGEDVRKEAAMSKLFTSETAWKVADDAIQIQGGVGLMKGNPAEWCQRMLRMFRILTGTSEIQRNTIAQQTLKRFAAEGWL